MVIIESTARVQQIIVPGDEPPPGSPRRPQEASGPGRHMAPYGPIWPHMASDGSRWPHMAPDGPRWSQMAPYGPIWSQMGSDGPRAQPFALSQACMHVWISAAVRAPIGGPLEGCVSSAACRPQIRLKQSSATARAQAHMPPATWTQSGGP